MVTAMNPIERHAAFYRGYLADDRNLATVAVVLTFGVALWLLVYLIASVGPHSDPRAERMQRSAAYLTSQRLQP